MALMPPVDFEAYGFELDLTEVGQYISYGSDDDDGSFPNRDSVLFSIFSVTDMMMELAVTPSLLDMPIDPPFILTVSTAAEIRAIIDTHRVRADRLDFQHERIAQYLALRHLNRQQGETLDQHDIAFITRLDLPYAKKLMMLKIA